MKKAALYARVSSKDQEKEGFSIPAQLKLLREYAVKNDFKIMQEFIDVETAKASGRKQFGEMLAFFQASPDSRVLIVEKTDRLYRNFKDFVLLEDLDVEIHLPKEGQIISKNSKSQAKFMHGIHVVMARNYIENLREEVRKGMLEKAAQGIYPSRPPLGYRNNRLNHTIEVDPEKVPIVKRIFEIYASGDVSLSELRKKVLGETGKKLAKGYLHKILKNPFYGGYFVWNGKTFKGTQGLIIDRAIFQKVQYLFANPNRSKYHKHDFAFSGLLTCAFDQCSVTAELKKKKYIYYHCTGYKGKCDLPYVREEVLGERLGQILEDIHIPDDVLAQLQNDLQSDSERVRTEKAAQRDKLSQRLAAVRRRIDQAYADKLDGRISPEFWNRMNTEWSLEEEQILMALQALEQANSDRLLTASRTLELANKAHSLYLRQSPQEQGKLLSNCATDGVSLSPTYKKPFDLIFARAKNEEWRARRDSNP